MAKSDRITIRLEPDMHAKLHEKASALGLDDAAYVRMLAYRDINGLEPTAPPAEPRAMRAVATSRQPHAARFQAEAPAFEPDTAAQEQPLDELVDADEPRADDMEIPADEDGGDPGSVEQVLAQGSDILDQMIAFSQAPPAVPARQVQRTYQRPGRNVMPVFGPGSRTRAVGVNDGAIGGNTYGDGTGNVLRDNMRHFGIVGTRSRA